MKLAPRLAASVALLVLLAVGGCSSQPIDVTWTVDGRPAAEACEAAGDTVRLRVISRDAPGAEAREAKPTASCAAGAATVEGGNHTTLFLELLRGEQVVGTAGPVELSPRTSRGDTSAALDIEVNTGRLEAELRVAGQSCGDAGAGSFEVVLRRATVSADTTVVDEATVTCEGGKAVYENANMKVGARHYLYARTVVDGEAYATQSRGQIVDVTRPLTRVVVDLGDEARPPVRDAGPDNLGDGGIIIVEPDAGSADAGPTETDAGSAGDAGSTETDAGSAGDAGTAGDAGSPDAGSAGDAGSGDEA